MPTNFPGSDLFPANVRIKTITDPALGGVDGAANVGLQDVADRTTYLNTRRLDDYTAQIEAASGGRATVKADINGNWHVMARIPAFKPEILDAAFVGFGASSSYPPAFRLNAATNITEFLVSLFPVSIDGNGDLATVPGVMADNSKTFSTAVVACADLGPGWHMLTVHEHAAIALWAMARITEAAPGTDLRGNVTASLTKWEKYFMTPANGTGVNFLGTGDPNWRHDGTLFGVADLVGGFQEEFVNLIKAVDAKLRFPSYNEFWKNEADWAVDSGVYLSKNITNQLCLSDTSVINNTGYTELFSLIASDYATVPAIAKLPTLCELLITRQWWGSDGVTQTWIAFLDNRWGYLNYTLSAGTSYFVRGGRQDRDYPQSGLAYLYPKTAAGDECNYRLAWIDPALIPV